MKTYDFDTVISRHNTNSMKWDHAATYNIPVDAIPMWVADMDFAAPIEVLEDIHAAVSHGIFGYSEPAKGAQLPGGYNHAVRDWFKARYGYDVPHIVKAPGVVSALNHCVRAFTVPGDAILIQTPVYYPFFNIVKDNNRTLVCNLLRLNNGKYTIDFVDFERKIVEHKAKMFILCSPHNPVGRAWTSEELAQLDELCRKHSVLVIADEIHCDFVWRGHEHICYGTLNPDAITLTAPSKTFNLAGLQCSNVFIRDDVMRDRFVKELACSGIDRINTLGLVACQSAYTKGGDWLAQLNEYLQGNIAVVRDFLIEKLPKIKLIEPEATYLLWLDFRELGLTQADLERRVIHDAKVWLSSGTIFGADGAGFMRMNVACPRSRLREALERLAQELGG